MLPAKEERLPLPPRDRPPACLLACSACAFANGVSKCKLAAEPSRTICLLTLSRSAQMYSCFSSSLHTSLWNPDSTTDDGDHGPRMPPYTMGATQTARGQAWSLLSRSRAISPRPGKQPPQKPAWTPEIRSSTSLWRRMLHHEPTVSDGGMADAITWTVTGFKRNRPQLHPRACTGQCS